MARALAWPKRWGSAPHCAAAGVRGGRGSAGAIAKALGVRLVPVYSVSVCGFMGRKGWIQADAALRLPLVADVSINLTALIPERSVLAACCGFVQ